MNKNTVYAIFLGAGFFMAGVFFDLNFNPVYKPCDTKKNTEPHLAKVDSNFKIEIKYYYSGYYGVAFTNNNWESERWIENLDPKGGRLLFYGNDAQKYIPKFKHLNTFEKCLKYNDSAINARQLPNIKIN